MSRTYTKSEYDNLDRRRKQAWAKYYQIEREQAENSVIIVNVIGRTEDGNLVEKSSLPLHITEEYYSMAEQLNKKYTCPICLDLVNRETIDITYCGHIFHKECLEASKQIKKECPYCRQKLY